MSSSPFASLKTQRLILRPFSMDDAPMLHAIAQEPDIFEYFPTKTAWDLKKVETNIRYHSEHWERFGYGQMAVTLAKSGQLMGWCGLEFLHETGETEVGYLLSRAFWGKGYATEAATASVQFGIRECHLKQIIGLTDPLNIASQRVLEKSGMMFTRKQVYFGMEMLRFAIQA